MGKEVDISYWERNKIEEVAQELFKKVAEKTDWVWKVDYQSDPDSEDRISVAYWTISGDSKQNNLSIQMVLGRVPWISRFKLFFSKDGVEYFCEEEIFKKILAFLELETLLDRIARKIKEEQDNEKERKKKQEKESLKLEKEHQADELIKSLRK